MMNKPLRRSTPLGLLLVSALVACCGAGGCASRRQPTVADWQATVEQYVQDAGGPAALRDAAGPDGRPGFSVLGGDRTENSTDVHGLLLGRRLVAGRPWLVFLVGRVKQQSVEDIRLAALSDQGGGGGRQWVLGDSDSGALEQYRRYNDGLWRGRFPGRSSAPPEYLSFPRGEDVFQLTVSDDRRLIASHPPSGARWEVVLPAPDGGAAASHPFAPSHAGISRTRPARSTQAMVVAPSARSLSPRRNS